MNVDKLIQCGQDVINYLDRGVSNDESDLTRMNKKFGCLHDNREQIGSWSNLINVAMSAAGFVRCVGIYSYCSIDLERAIDECGNDDRANRVRSELIFFL